MMRLRHGLRLTGDLLRFGRLSGATWFIPVVIILLLVAVLVVTSHAVTPYVVYTFF